MTADTKSEAFNPTGEVKLDPEIVERTIRSRRTIKPPMMSDAPVSEQDLRAILESANWAPSHGLTEPWRFRIFRGDARATLADSLSELYLRVVPPDQQKPGKAEKLAEMPRLAPVVILVWMKRQEIEKIRELEEIEAVACAVQNMHLSATARGLGAFWSTPPFLYDAAMNAWMGIGERDRCLGIFYLGHPSADSAGRRGDADRSTRSSNGSTPDERSRALPDRSFSARRQGRRDHRRLLRLRPSFRRRRRGCGCDGAARCAAGREDR